MRGEEAKNKRQDCCVTFKLKNKLEILFSEHDQMLELMLCIWNRRLCEVLNSQSAFWLIVARQ